MGGIELKEYRAAAPGRDMRAASERALDNRRAAIFLGSALVLAATFAMLRFSLFLWIVEISYISCCFGITAFSYSVRSFTGDDYPLHIGVAFLFNALVDLAFFYLGSLDREGAAFLSPSNLFFWICTCWYQAFTYLVLIRTKTATLSIRAVFGTYAAITLALHLAYVLVPALRDIGADAFGAGYLLVNRLGLAGFYLFLFARMFGRLAGVTRHFARLLFAGAVFSLASALLGTWALDRAPFLLFPAWFAKFAGVYLCFKAAVSYTLLDPYTRLHGSLIRQAAELSDSNRVLGRALTEKEILIKEVHHRVKNNLQVVSSLLSLQAGGARSEEARESLRESQTRIMAMSFVHERLYRQADLSSLELKDYLYELVGELCSTLAGGRIACRFEGEPVGVSADAAINCGLIVNELVMNAVKHAFPGERAGRITVRVAREAGGDILAEVADDGIGLPEGFDPTKADSMGMVLVHSLAGQLGGTVAFDRGAEGRGGTRVRLVFGPRAS